MSYTNLHRLPITLLPFTRVPTLFLLFWKLQVIKQSKLYPSDARDSKPRPVPHFGVLPPGEFNQMIPVPLLISPERFIMIAVTWSQYIHRDTQQSLQCSNWYCSITIRTMNTIMSQHFDLCHRRNTSLEQSAPQPHTMWAVARPVQAVTRDIFIRTVRQVLPTPESGTTAAP